MTDIDEEAKVFGAAVAEHRKVIARILGPSALDAALAALPEDMREEVENTSVLSWCRQRSLIALQVEAAKIAGLDPDVFIADVVRAAMKQTFRGVWKILFKLTSDEAIVRRAGLVYRKSVSKGRLTSEIIGNGEAIARLLDWPNPPRTHAIATAASIEAFMNVVERRRAEVTWQRDGEDIEFHITWNKQ